MADLTMCLSSDCPLRERCYRHGESGTHSHDRQSVMHFTWSETNGCGDFIDARPFVKKDAA